MDKVGVTVGMLVHNDADGVLRAAPSILGQTWQGDLRLVVVNDGSSDRTAEALTELAEAYQQIHVITNAERQGSARACRQIIELAGRDYSAWADTRFVWLPRRLERQLATLLREERRTPGSPVLCTAPVRTTVLDAGGVRSASRDAGLDLEPATLLGRAEHFKTFGGFDLGTASGREFVKRFAKEDGRVVSPLDPTPLASVTLTGEPRPRSRGLRPRAIARGILQRGAHALWKAMPVLRRSRIMRLARRAGLINALATRRAGRALLDEVKATADTARLNQDHTALAAEIEQGADPPAFLRIEQLAREAGYMHTAETALRRGLEQFPDDAALRVRLIELLPLRRKWSEAAELWAHRGDADKRLTGRLTYVRAARALRESGAAEAAVAVASEAAETWPADRQVRNELRVSRAALVEWKHAITVAGDSAAGPSGIHDLGFLTGLDLPVTGTVAADPGQRCRVSVVVNGVPIASTDAAPTADEGVRAVSLRFDDALEFLGDGDVITFECDGQPLWIQGVGTRCHVTTGYESHFSELDDLLREGYMFTKFGDLRRGHTQESKRQVLHLFDKVSKFLMDSYGYRAFPLYGNLLGCIREHDFIAHDIGGFDMGYVSSHSTAPAVREEFMKICRSLIAQGYFLRVEPFSVYVRPSARSKVFVDLNFAWFTESRELQISGGWRFAPVRDGAHFRLHRTSLLASHVVSVPGNAEDILKQLYGDGWAVPDQGFSLEAGLQRADEYLLTSEDIGELEDLDPDRVQAALR